VKVRLTVVAAGDAAAGLAVGGVARVLLEARVGDAAAAGGHRPFSVRTGAGHERVLVLGKGGGEGGKAEDKAGEGELHVGGEGVLLFVWCCWEGKEWT
jgi:hypothetical protein